MWNIQNKVFGEEQDLMIRAFQELDIPYSITDGPDRTLDNLLAIPRGSVEFVKNYPNLISINRYNYSNYCNDLCLNNPYIILPWKKLKNSLWLVDSIFPNCDSIFIRPQEGRKIFTGTTLTKKWWEKELQIIESLPSSDNLTYNSLVIVAEAKKIEGEIRSLFFNGKLIDYCLYDGEAPYYMDNIENILNLCYASIGYIDKFIALDLACYNTHDYAILEVNNGFSSGWYDMDYKKIIKVINDAYHW